MVQPEKRTHLRVSACAMGEHMRPFEGGLHLDTNLSLSPNPKLRRLGLLPAETANSVDVAQSRLSVNTPRALVQNP